MSGNYYYFTFNSINIINNDYQKAKGTSFPRHFNCSDDIGNGGYRDDVTIVEVNDVTQRWKPNVGS